VSKKSTKTRRESEAVKKKRVRNIIGLLRREFPDAATALNHSNPFELLVATILSAQCTDKRVNMVTPALFERYPDPEALAVADQEDVEKLIQSTGFFRNKAKNIIGCARGIVANHRGDVPDTMEDLTALDGVGRKTANVVLGNAFGKNVGVVVDTHVGRISRHLGFTEVKDPVKVERDLMAIIPTRDWTVFSHYLILHGRATCIARRPLCSQCVLYDYCPGRQEASE
jgi:endonuclease-3